LGQGNNETIVISSSDFLFAQAQDNYVELTYLKNGKISKHLLRTTFKNLKETILLDYIHKCHRSFIVNLYQVQSIKGNLNNLTLNIRGVNYSLPVSKTYAYETLLRLKDYKQFH
jgi:DNA-binding LytR/AlgR family response regulator